MGKGAFDTPFFRTAGDKGVLVEFGSDIHPDINKK